MLPVLLINLIMLMLLPTLTDTLICISHHEYREDGKIRLINLNHCGAYNGFCVKVKFWDKDPLKKRGYSRGCDKNDCLEFGNPEYGWNEQGCRRNQDYGSDGEICCCKTDMCNPASVPSNKLTAYMLYAVIVIKLFTVLNHYLLFSPIVSL